MKHHKLKWLGLVCGFGMLLGSGITAQAATTMPRPESPETNMTTKLTTDSMVPTVQTKQVNPQVTVTEKGIPADRTLDSYTPVQVNVDFDTQGQPVVAGDYFALTWDHNLNFQPNSLSLNDYVNVEAIKNGVNVSFTDRAAASSNVKGNLTFQLRLSPTTIPGTTVNTAISVNNQPAIKSSSVTAVVPKDNPHEIFAKYQMNSTAHNGTDWALRINASEAKLTNAVITDQLSGYQGTTYDPKSFKLDLVHWDWDPATKAWTTYTMTESLTPSLTNLLTFATDMRSFKLNLGDLAQGAVLLYSVQFDVPSEQLVNGEYGNQATLTTTNQTPATSSLDKVFLTNGSATGAGYQVKVHKIGSDQKQLAGATINLVGKNDLGQLVDLTTTTDVNGEAVLTSADLLKGTYTLTETKAPTGYAKFNPFTITIGNDSATRIEIPVSQTQDTLIVTKIPGDYPTYDLPKLTLPTPEPMPEPTPTPAPTPKPTPEPTPASTALLVNKKVTAVVVPSLLTSLPQTGTCTQWNLVGLGLVLFSLMVGMITFRRQDN